MINIPFIYFVTECMTTSAPRDKGRYKIIIFCSAVKLIQTKWLEISNVITETKVKKGFSFQIKVRQFGIFLMTVDSGDWVSNPLFRVWNFALKGFLWVISNKEMALIFLWKEGERGRVRFWYKISTNSSAYPWCFWKPLVSVKASQSDFQIVTRIFFPIQNT